MGQTAIIFPGQGAQLVGMGADLVEASSRVSELYARAGELVGFDLGRVCFDGPASAIETTDVQQPAILVTSIAYLEAFYEQGGTPDVFAAAAGLSLGEYTALYFAGSLSFDDAVRLVHRRGQLMQQAAQASPSGMVSLVGADEAKAQALCALAAEGDVLVPANLNCPGQVVISGSKDACLRAVEKASEAGCRAIPLKVAGAFHSPLMQPAADALGEVLAETEIRSPRIPVLSNVTAQPHTTPEEIRRLLQAQVTSPVRWQASIESLLGDGFDRFVEFGPNRVLTGMMRKIDRSAQTVTVNTLEAVRNQDMLAPAS